MDIDVDGLSKVDGIVEHVIEHGCRVRFLQSAVPVAILMTADEYERLTGNTNSDYLRENPFGPKGT